MPSKRVLLISVATFAIVLGFLAMAAPALGASREKTLHIFKNNDKDGYYPRAGLIFDTAGHLYGTTWNGGAHGEGTVFELTLGSNGKWKENVLHTFEFNGRDGSSPLAGLVFDAARNLYGTTSSGGTYGYGTVFQLTPGANGKWREKVLHSFHDTSKDGAWPSAGLVLDAAGNLYSTTWTGPGYGSVFELTRRANGRWIEKVLHSFNSQDGAFISSGVIFDGGGNLYGTTFQGGAYKSGTVFELSPSASGTWTQTVLYSFCSASNCTDGEGPVGGLTFDAAGNLYGMTDGPGYGTVFELSPSASGTWTETVLYSFCSASNCTDGQGPVGGLIFDTTGNLYGTTQYGGETACNPGYGCGVVFKLSPSENRTWTETVLRSFNFKDGAAPLAGLTLDAAGNLYGTTSNGGNQNDCWGYGCGIVFEIAP